MNEKTQIGGGICHHHPYQGLVSTSRIKYGLSGFLGRLGDDL